MNITQRGHLLLKFHTHENNKYVIFYSLWPCLSHSLVESHGDQMYFFCFVIVIMAGFEDNNFSLSGLTQQGHKLDVTVISSSDEDDNYGGLLECARQLGGEISEPTMCVEGGMQPLVEPCVEPNASNFPIS